ncbi:putative PurR-regulated permease PerM [Paenibacillus shirakamiensis]|uniref:PurR-regulated permease PerM n=1 Tax=Paenibacillus shirakamiensis TaxID=1265935 RepID=A0ABS4JJA6_9BACL|nr:AI-2E family transporter [Paenibacillus shirakamiensis]MBP2001205.1 putative PurR-regulated permease PerM [Paenibacillus shirakamiensis]
MTFFKELFAIAGVRRFFALIFLVVMLYVFQSMLNLILITFILTYLINRLHKIIIKSTERTVRLNNTFTVAFIYIVLISLVVYTVYKYFPVLVTELNELVNQVITFYNKPPMDLPDNMIVNYLVESINKIDLASYIDTGFNFIVKTVTDIGKWSFNVFIAIILSLFFLLEKEKVIRFTSKFRASKASYFFNELEYFGRKFVQSFGKIIEVQFLISLTNALLSTGFLWVMGFPNLIALGMMIFLLGLVPVLGVFVSLIPLCAIAFKIGGAIKVIYILIMIVVLHALESYVLNPKFMSSKTHLPIFYTFTILLVSEHFFGVWGLIVGVPVFMFFLDILEVPVGVGIQPALQAAVPVVEDEKIEPKHIPEDEAVDIHQPAQDKHKER